MHYVIFLTNCFISLLFLLYFVFVLHLKLYNRIEFESVVITTLRAFRNKHFERTLCNLTKKYKSPYTVNKKTKKYIAETT